MNKTRLSVLIITITAIVIGFLIYNNSLFRISGTTPGLNNVSVISPFIDVHFSKQITVDGLSLNSENLNITGFESPDNKTLRIYFEEIILDEEYSISIDVIKSNTGKELKNKVITFTPKDIPFESLSGAQKEAILKNQDKTSNIKSDPILAHVPYGGLNYQLDADSRADGLVLIAEIRLSKADVTTDKASAVALYKQEVLYYIQSKGLNPNSYTIEYKIIEPSIY